MPKATYTAQFSSEVSLAVRPSAYLSGPDSQIPSGSVIEEVWISVYCGVSSYNATLDASFDLSDSSGRVWSVSDKVYTESSNRIWAEFGGEPDVELDWNSLSSITLGGTTRLTVRPNYTATLTIEYETPTAPTPPSSVKVSPSSVAGGKATLSWSGASGGTSNPIAQYEVYRSTEAGSGYTLLARTTATSISVDSAAGNGSAYYFKVKCIGSFSGLDSGLSSAYATLRTQWSAPGTPGTPALAEVLTSPNAPVSLSWAASSAGTNNPVARYDVYRSVDGGEYEFLASTGTNSTQVTAPTINGREYRYKVLAVGKVSGSDSELSAASEALQCTFSAPTAPSGLLVDGAERVYIDAKQEATLTWQAGAGGENNPLVAYWVYKNGVFLASTTSLYYKVNASYKYGETLTFTVRTHAQFSDSGDSNAVQVTSNTPPVPPRSTEAISEFMIFDKDDNLLFLRGDAISLTVTEQEYRCSGTFPFLPEKKLEHGMRIGWLEPDELMLFELRQLSTDTVQMTQRFEADHIAMAELLDEPIEEKRPYDVTAENAAMQALEDTQWVLGTVMTDGTLGSANFYYESAWAALLKVREEWGVSIRPRLLYTYNGIERYIDLLDRLGENRGVRLVLNMNVQQAGVTYDDRELYTALYGRGSSTGEGERLLNFADAYWNTANGDPVNKPIGQEWVEDPAATALYGRKGRRRTGFVRFDTLDPYELLSLTWNALKEASVPKVTIKLTAFDLSALGYAYQGIGLGDDVVAVLDPIGVEMRLRVSMLTRDVLRPENSKPTIGTYRPDVAYKIAKM